MKSTCFRIACGVMSRALCALIVGFSALASMHAVAQVYRCVENGATVYSDRQCASGNTQRIEIQRSGPQPTGDESNLQAEANMGRVAVGQTPLQVRTAWGQPTAINKDTYGDRVREQWVYRRDGGDAYVYFAGGAVTSVSTRSETASAPPPVAVPRIFTREEREAIERSSKAGDRKFVSTSTRTGLAEVRARIGEPDYKTFSTGFQHWIYLPDPNDPQTRTTLRFTADGLLVDVRREVHP